MRDSRTPTASAKSTAQSTAAVIATSRLPAMPPGSIGSAIVIMQSITKKWQSIGTSADASTASSRPPVSCPRPRKNAASESGFEIVRSSSEPPRTATTERTGTCATKRCIASAWSSVQTTKNAMRSAEAKARNAGTLAASVAARRRCQSVAQPNT